MNNLSDLKKEIKINSSLAVIEALDLEKKEFEENKHIIVNYIKKVRELLYKVNEISTNEEKVILLKMIFNDLGIIFNKIQILENFKGSISKIIVNFFDIYVSTIGTYEIISTDLRFSKQISTVRLLRHIEKEVKEVDGSKKYKLLEDLVSSFKDNYKLGLNVSPWYLTSKLFNQYLEKDNFINGGFKLSIKSGVLNIIFTLIDLIKSGLEVENQRNEIKKGIEFLKDLQCVDRKGIMIWKQVVPVERYLKKEIKILDKITLNDIIASLEILYTIYFAGHQLGDIKYLLYAEEGINMILREYLNKDRLLDFKIDKEISQLLILISNIEKIKEEQKVKEVRNNIFEVLRWKLENYEYENNYIYIEEKKNLFLSKLIYEELNFDNSVEFLLN